ncbi:flagellar hook-associated protein 3 [Halolactibacillus alkaliphilus]|uniref:Flagellar hook-associated protein 3 n=1 Tax=Halolactibacillus alkaliphilus TaxID=442899 RepID=A0A511X2D0_9BACI|nr:flagellar hook-associated protein FlgL [Halolactibacillus alkaliphilus]GEN57095.1 flagellar hook-associated protein 3 [Halolactibacillus alkaliphilus]GGN71904.1 flagellar hook-associated protein 3 [Halolactibacillus alkaliphilus]SFO86846.1 flagellar hook-associated protein 3 FlgL [Halolactibacillus alkaliphilus]
MRVTQSMLSNNMLRNLSKSYTSMNKYMDQLTTGKKINRPSDDPVIAMKGMRYRTEVGNVEQFQRNITEMHTWMETSDDTLDETTQILNRLRDLTVQAANGTYEQNQREAIAKEVDQLQLQLVEAANTKVNNKYIFNGTQTTGVNKDGELLKPVTLDDDGNPVVNLAPGDYQAVELEVTSGTRLQANVNPTNVYSQELFDDIKALSDALKSDVPDSDFDRFITIVDKHIDNTVSERADLGARMNRVELIESRLEGQRISARDMMSKNEDADIAEVIMNLTSQEAIHRAALSAGSRVIQPTLLDFLR